MTNVYWREVAPTASVELVGEPGGRQYVIEGESTAYWHGNEAERAQRYLDGLVEATIKRRGDDNG